MQRTENTHVSQTALEAFDILEKEEETLTLFIRQLIWMKAQGILQTTLQHCATWMIIWSV